MEPPPTTQFAAGATAGGGHGHGRGSVTARCESGRTVLSQVHATSPLRFLRPTFPGTRAATVCLLTFGGGLVDGDAIDVEVGKARPRVVR